MGVISLLTGQSGKLKIGQFNVDVCLQETPGYEAEITENPIESGSTVSDHVILKPVTLSLEGIHSDTPIMITDIVALTGIRNSQVDQIADSRAGSLYTALVGLWNDRTPFTIVSGLDTYEMMCVQKVSFPRDPQLGRALKFTAEFRRVTLVEAQTVKISGKVLSKLTRQDMGRQAPKVVNPNGPPSGIMQLWHMFRG